MTIFYIEFRRAAGSLEAARELQISGKLVDVHDRHILEAQLLAPKTRKVRDHTVQRRRPKKWPHAKPGSIKSTVIPGMKKLIIF